jgi:hypothetical protein
MHTYVYVEGFNLYYGALKGTKYKWLDLKALFAGVLRPQNRIERIKYYTARVAARPDDLAAPTLQDIYLKALAMHIADLDRVISATISGRGGGERAAACACCQLGRR